MIIDSHCHAGHLNSGWAVSDRALQMRRSAAQITSCR